mgnify:CR=1 FL=1
MRKGVDAGECPSQRDVLCAVEQAPDRGGQRQHIVGCAARMKRVALLQSEPGPGCPSCTWRYVGRWGQTRNSGWRGTQLPTVSKAPHDWRGQGDSVSAACDHACAAHTVYAK